MDNQKFIELAKKAVVDYIEQQVSALNIRKSSYIKELEEFDKEDVEFQIRGLMRSII